MPNKVFGQAAFTVSATSSSALTVNFASTTPAICSTTGTNGATVTLLATGTCSLTASQAGNANYAAATAVTQSFGITQDVAPSVSIASPTAGQSFHAPAVITLTANASSSDATITQVQYYNGSALIGSATQAPYSVTWSNVAMGSYSITAVATDDLGTSSTSAPLAVTVSTPVIVTLTSPANNQSFGGGSAITLAATATDALGTITQVSFYNGSSLLASMTQAPYSITVSDLPEGSNSLTAQATDSNGQTGTSSAVVITVTAGTGGGNGQVAYDVGSDQLGTSRVITDQAGNVVWQWDNTDPYGNNLPNQDPNGTGERYLFNLRLPGQYADIETGTYYNYFRDYDPSIGRYIESDPIGLFGGQISTYSYVDDNSLSNIDANGLAIVIGYPTGNSADDKAWYAKYRALIRANAAMENRLKSLCGPDKDKLLDIFNKWRISVDPNIDSITQRNRSDYGVTNYKYQSTYFTLGFFSDDSEQMPTFYHEFRHLMSENNALRTPAGDMNSQIGHRERDPAEVDADAWSAQFAKRDCSCQKKN